MPARDGPHKVNELRYKMVPASQLSAEQIHKYAPEIDVNAPAAAFAQVRIPIEPDPAPVRAKRMPSNTKRRDDRDVLADMMKEAGQQINTFPVEHKDLVSIVDNNPSSQVK